MTGIINSNTEHLKMPKRGRLGSKYRVKKRATSSAAARDATLLMKVEQSGRFSKKDLDKFITTFFPEKHPLPYSRLSPLLKLTCCQWTLHNHPEEGLRAYPIVFLLSPELQALNDSYLRKKIQRELKSVLGETPLYWYTIEYKNQSEEKLKHLNFEILLYPNEAHKVEETLKKLSGLYEIDPATNKAKINADGSKKQRKGLDYAVEFRNDKRLKLIEKHGEFYAVYNWPGYATKQFKSRARARDKTKPLLTANTRHSDKQDEKMYYISAQLNKMTSEFYSTKILKNRKRKNPAYGSW